MRAETQLPLLETPNYRRTDPATAREAGEAITRSGRRKRHQAVLLALVESFPDRTAAEYSDLLVSERAMHWYRAYQLANKRISDLHSKGLVAVSGQRQCRVTGRMARTWRAT